MITIRKKIKAYRLFGNKKLHSEVDKTELAPFLINYYLNQNTEQRIQSFMVIMDTFFTVQQHNDKREVNYSKPDIVIQPHELIVHFNAFINFFIHENDSHEVIKFIAKNNKDLFFRILEVHSQNTEKNEELVDFLCIPEFIKNISYTEFLKYFKRYDTKHDPLNYTHSYFFQKFVLYSEDRIKLFLEYCYTDYQKDLYKCSFRLSSAIDYTLGIYLNKNLKYKIDFFETIFSEGIDYDNLYQSRSIREYMDKECLVFFADKLYAAIPDSYSKIKEDRGLGIYSTIKLLDQIPDYRQKPDFYILNIINRGSVKKRFYKCMETYSEYDFAKMIKVFKTQFPHLYKATFINKNPPFISPKKPETKIYLDKALLIMNMEDIEYHKKKQERI